MHVWIANPWWREKNIPGIPGSCATLNGSGQPWYMLMSNTINRFLLFLQALWLSRNIIFEILDMAFRGLETLYELHIAHNLLTSAPSLVNLRSTLQFLDLSWNKIISISDSYFNFCTYITNIHLDFNQPSDFPSMQAISNTISVVSLEGNNISLVDPMYGIYFPRLTHLQLARNQIESYCFPPRHFAPWLSQVYLQNNKLSEIQFSHITSHARKAEIFLGGNPWHCNNALGWTEQCVLGMDSNMYCLEWLTLHDMICTSPLEAQGMTPIEAGGYIDGLVHARRNSSMLATQWSYVFLALTQRYIVTHKLCNRFVKFSTFQRVVWPLLLTGIN